MCSRHLPYRYVFFFSKKIWLPPTPPTDERPEYYVDLALGMWYDTSSAMTPDELGPITVYWYVSLVSHALYKYMDS